MKSQSTDHSVVDNADWVGTDIASDKGWIHQLGAHEIADLKAMARAIRPLLGGDANRLMSLPSDTFSLGNLTTTMDNIYRNLKVGSGIALLRGLPIDELELIDIATIYWAIGLHLGKATPNNPEGDMFGHVTDLGKTQRDPKSRGYQTRETMDYHSDQSDMVALICIRGAKSGGESRVASSVAMYNELLRRHPEYAKALSVPLYWTKHGEHAANESPWYKSAVFNFYNEQLCTSFGPKHILKGHSLPDTPALTDLQRDAIRVAEEIADEQRYDMTFQPGDIQILNNYVILHTRSGYEDFDEPSKKRLLWRLWLMNDDLRIRTNYSKQWQRGVSPGGVRKQIRL